MLKTIMNAKNKQLNEFYEQPLMDVRTNMNVRSKQINEC